MLQLDLVFNTEVKFCILTMPPSLTHLSTGCILDLPFVSPAGLLNCQNGTIHAHIHEGRDVFSILKQYVHLIVVSLFLV